eukprot:213142-Hanusia_phi.AAC.1
MIGKDTIHPAVPSVTVSAAVPCGDSIRSYGVRARLAVTVSPARRIRAARMRLEVVSRVRELRVSGSVSPRPGGASRTCGGPVVLRRGMRGYEGSESMGL